MTRLKPPFLVPHHLRETASQGNWFTDINCCVITTHTHAQCFLAWDKQYQTSLFSRNSLEYLDLVTFFSNAHTHTHTDRQSTLQPDEQSSGRVCLCVQDVLWLTAVVRCSQQQLEQSDNNCKPLGFIQGEYCVFVFPTVSVNSWSSRYSTGAGVSQHGRKKTPGALHR